MIKLENGNLKFTEEEVSSILYDGGIWDEDTQKDSFIVVSEKIIDHDTEKSSVTKRIVIKEISTDKSYAAELGKSRWIHQEEYNAKVEWKEVKPRKVTNVEYD